MTSIHTRASHAGGKARQVAEEPLSPPIWQVADWAYASAEHYFDVINERRHGQIYGRYGTPTAEMLAELMADLEKAEAGWVFGSGMGAIHAVLMHVAGAGSRVAAAATLYGGTYGLFTAGAERAGIEVEFFDATDASSLPDLAKFDAVFVEGVANPTFEIADLEGIASLCRRAGVPLVVDNTVATPVLLNPVAHGAELVVHSTSKYVGGHHDLMGGAAVGSRQRIDEIRHLAIRYGTTASALESWLALRGSVTLPLRVERQSATAALIAAELEGAPGVERVLYPGLPSHPQHGLATKLLERGYGGMIAVDLGSQGAAWTFMDSLELARVGSSFGGARSEVTHPATTSHRQFSPQDRVKAGITDGLVRISIGLEDPQELLEDFMSGLRG